MLATPGDLPTGPGWIYEVKWDGMRLLADVADGRVELRSRSGRDVTANFPELAGLAQLAPDVLLDGEVVLLEHGVPSFHALADRMQTPHPAPTRPVTLMAFDVLRLYGVDLLARRWSERRATLERLELSTPRWQTPPTFTDGPALHAATREQGLEGIVSKRVDSPYVPGVRSPYWLKSPHRGTVSVVIGGWRPEIGGAGARRLGAVLVGVPGPGGLRYLGRVGSGLAGRVGQTLLHDLTPLASVESPFRTEVPREDADGATWVHPVLVADVQSLGLSSQGRLRQPAYKGLRTDLTPGDVDDHAEGE